MGERTKFLGFVDNMENVQERNIVMFDLPRKKFSHFAVVDSQEGSNFKRLSNYIGKITFLDRETFFTGNFEEVRKWDFMTRTVISIVKFQ